MEDIIDKQQRAINFYPGPSKIHEGYGRILSELINSGIASYNHRSLVFEESYRFSVSVLKEKLNLPEGYDICFLGSATECWESISKTFKDKHSLFYFNGSFGEKWAKFGKRSIHKIEDLEFQYQSEISLIESKAELICYVQNETSNATQLTVEHQINIRTKYPNSLIAVDATSSLGGVELNLESCDIVFSSVQKCLGMPAGLAVVILSPRAIEEIEQRESNTYNDLMNVWANHKISQTTHTPNILAILGIGNLFKDLPCVTKYSEIIKNRKLKFEKVIEESSVFDFWIAKSSLRSDTVFCLKHSNPHRVLREAEEKGLILGKGYGKWKESSIRIANFPAHTESDFNTLIKFIKQCK